MLVVVDTNAAWGSSTFIGWATDRPHQQYRQGTSHREVPCRISERTRDHDMPAKDFISKFKFDAATFDEEQFKARLLAEITADEELSTAAVTTVTQERDALATVKRDLQSRLWEATVMQQGTPVTPKDSPANTAGGNTAPTPVAESDIFQKVEL